MRTISNSIGLLSILLVCVVCGPAATAQTPAPRATPSSQLQPPAAADLLLNGRAPFDGILTGGQPTPEQFAAIADLGYKTVVNLRSPTEEGSTDPAAIEALGMAYVSLPVTSADDVDETRARALAEILNTVEYPVVVQCGSGNRVGAIFAMKAFYVDGLSADEALEIGRAAGVTRLEPVVKQKLGLE